MAGATSSEEKGEGLVRTPICGFLVLQGEAMGSEREKDDQGEPWLESEQSTGRRQQS